MKSFEQLRRDYLSKASEAEIRAAAAADPKAMITWQTMADGYLELAAECDVLAGRNASSREGIAA
jgi:hypothetical protein